MVRNIGYAFSGIFNLSLRAKTRLRFRRLEKQQLARNRFHAPENIPRIVFEIFGERQIEKKNKQTMSVVFTPISWTNNLIESHDEQKRYKSVIKALKIKPTRTTLNYIRKQVSRLNNGINAIKPSNVGTAISSKKWVGT